MFSIIRTNIKNIYAIGDVIPGPMLAHKGEEEGVAAIEHICGEYSHINYNNIPSVVYTHPEIASIGFTEEELKAKSKYIINNQLLKTLIMAKENSHS